MDYNFINKILESNQEFIDRMGKDFFLNHQDEQNPIMTMVTCSDSRVQTEIFQHTSINKTYVIRNIGNQIYSNEGSVDYGVLILKTPILFILGHPDCGAIKSFTEGYEKHPKSIQNELNNLIPVFPNEESSIVKRVIINIHHQVEIAMKKYGKLVTKNDLMIIGGIYDFRNEMNEGYAKLKIMNINGKIDV